MAFFASLLLLTAQSNQEIAPKQQPTTALQSQVADPSFTGKISKNRVRIRLKPSLDGPIIRECNKDDLVVVTNSVDDFYAVLPEKQMKGYIFRTYVLDGKVIGNHVHLRLEPDTTSPIIQVMNEGDAIEGTPCSSSNKWLECKLPDNVRFYVAKEFVSRIGSLNVYNELMQKRASSEDELRSIEKAYEEEIKKQVDTIRLQPLVTRLQTLIESEKDFSAIQEKGRTLLQKIQEGYFKKNLLTPNIEAEKTIEAEKKVKPEPEKSIPQVKEPSGFIQTDLRQREEEFVSQAIQEGKFANKEAFYREQEKSAVVLEGLVQPSIRAHANIPGDFLLLDAKTHLPQCYLYSTTVDLKALVGKTVKLHGAERPNNDYAYKAYFILKAE